MSSGMLMSNKMVSGLGHQNIKFEEVCDGQDLSHRKMGLAVLA